MSHISEEYADTFIESQTGSKRERYFYKMINKDDLAKLNTNALPYLVLITVEL
jgi:hypothetical protein